MKAVPTFERTAHSLEGNRRNRGHHGRSARRRLDFVMLRWQARLDAPVWDRSLPWLTPLGLAVVLSLLALARYRDLGVGYELGHYVQAAYLMEWGLPGNQRPGLQRLCRPGGLGLLAVGLGDALSRRMSRRCSWCSRWRWPSGGPIWRIARGPANLRVGGAAALMLAYALHPSVHDLNLAGFHPEALAIPGPRWPPTWPAMPTGGVWWPFWCFPVVCTRSDLGLAVVALGLVMVGEDRRTPGVVPGRLWSGVVSADVVLVQPLLGDGDYPHLGAFAHYGDGLLGIVLGMLSDPVGPGGDLFGRAGFEKVLLLLAPVLFLPLVRPRYLAPVLPLLALYLVADVDDAGYGNPQQDVAVLGPLCLSPRPMP
ncbi:MAG: hypothetical protein Ct9H300mP12_00240 [Acidimicrobiales bacterium]|nr:MAG: hypothetical protein Ct9H300mP12_00240 [Acidimicrobiales bacterium]